MGLEASAKAELSTRGFRFPLSANYTFNRSRFQSGFSSSNPQWGEVEDGFEIPYLPSHQVAVGLGVGHSPRRHHRWELSLAGRFTSAMRDAAGTGDVPSEQRSDAATVLDFAASYSVERWGKAYLTVANVLDQAHIVSRRPFGARPGSPGFSFLVTRIHSEVGVRSGNRTLHSGIESSGS